MLKNTDSQTMVEQMQQRQKIYDAICKPNWVALCRMIDGLLQIGTKDSWEALGNLIKKEELQIYEAFYNEWKMLKFAFEIYQKEEKHYISQVIFCGIDNIDRLDRKMNCLKFGLLRIENKIAVDDEFGREWEMQKFSDIAIVEAARKVCRNSNFVLKQIGIQER